ncbi:MAG: hypothetical protein ABIW19_16470, partial [Vicinamibacterales bacterium]
IRAAVSSAAPALTGSVHTFLDIGNVGKTSLAVSGLMLHTEAAARLISAAPPGGWLPVAPTTARTFDRQARVTAALRLFRRPAPRPEPVRVVVDIVDARGQRVGHEESLAPDFDASGLSDIRFAVPLSTLSPGDYLMTVTIGQGKTAGSRTAQFVVN